MCNGEYTNRWIACSGGGYSIPKWNIQKTEREGEKESEREQQCYSEKKRPSERYNAIKIQQTHLLPAERRLKLTENKFNVMDFMSDGSVYGVRWPPQYILVSVCARVYVWLGFLLNFITIASAIVFLSLSPDTVHHLACLIPLASVCCVRV